MSSATIQVRFNCPGLEQYPLMFLGLSVLVLIILCPFILYRTRIYLQDHPDVSFVTGEIINQPSISKMWRIDASTAFMILTLDSNGILYTICLVQPWFIAGIWIFGLLVTIIYSINPDPPDPRKTYSREELNKILLWRRIHAGFAAFLFTTLLIISSIMAAYYYNWSTTSIVLLSLMGFCWIMLTGLSVCMYKAKDEFDHTFYNELWSWCEFGLAVFFCFFVTFIPAGELVH